MIAALIVMLGVSVVAHGFLWAAMTRPFGVTIDTAMAAIRADQLIVALQAAAQDIAPGTSTVPVYLASESGIQPARGLFFARINGERAIVIETGETI